MEIRLTLTETQAKTIAGASEFYARMRMGQFQELPYRFLDIKALGSKEYSRRREYAQQRLLEVRKIIYPELNGIGHSYGVGKFKDADLAFDIYQVIRYAFGDERTPFSYHPLPKIEINNERQIKNREKATKKDVAALPEGAYPPERIVELTFDEDQFIVFCRVCDFYSRIQPGNYIILVDAFMDRADMDSGEYELLRRKAEEILFDIQRVIYPDLKDKEDFTHFWDLRRFPDAFIVKEIDHAIHYMIQWAGKRKPVPPLKCEIIGPNVTEKRKALISSPFWNNSSSFYPYKEVC